MSGGAPRRREPFPLHIFCMQLACVSDECWWGEQAFNAMFNVNGPGLDMDKNTSVAHVAVYFTVKR